MKKTHLASYPTSVVLYINKNCNYTCDFCYNQDILNQTSLSHTIITPKILEQFFNTPFGHNALRIALMGGEPFLNENIFDLIDICYKNNKITNIVTNASLLSQTNLNKITNSKLNVIGLSLYAQNKDEIAQAVTYFNQTHFNYWVQTIVDIEHLEKLHKILQYATKYKIKNFILSNYNPYFNGKFEKSLHTSNLNYKKEYLKLKKEFSKKINIIWPIPLPPKDNNQKVKQCRLPFNYIHLDNQGNIGPCCYRYPQNKFGNIYHLPFWNSAEIKKVRANLLSNTPPITECTNCENLYRSLYF